MKKFIIIIILVVVLALLIFFRGWTQIRISPDECGVINSVFSGVNEKPVEPGIFSWNWQFILPKTGKLKKFPLKPYNSTKTVSGIIPQIYYTSSYNDLLSYTIDYSISLSYTPESIISLYSKNYISDEEDLVQYLDNAASYICQLTSSYIVTKAKSDPSFNPQSLTREELLSASKAYVNFPDLDITIFAINSYKLPNYSLYNKIESENLINTFGIQK